MNKQFTLLFIIFSVGLMAQNGISYKALIKDTNGNVVSNQSVDFKFSIQFDGASGSGTTFYEEDQTATTDQNGIVVLEIGNGTPTLGDFSNILWERTNLLHIQLDIEQDGTFVDFGNQAISASPRSFYADRAGEADNVTGLEVVNENGNEGWRLIGRDPNFHGEIGDNAVDLSWSSTNFRAYGATAQGSFATGGATRASGSFSTVHGLDSEASGYVSTAMGGHTYATGNFSTALGYQSDAESYASVAIGRYNIGGGNFESWNSSDPLFEIGNGTSDNNRSNALTVAKSGRHTINSSTTGLIINDAGSDGILIFSPNSDGIEIEAPGDDGIQINSPGDDGIYIWGAQQDGIDASAANYGGRFFGDVAGIYASGDSGSLDTPDIILGSANIGPLSDDGIISTNPERSSSDMFLRSYDAVVVQLDYDDNEAGHFRVRNGTGTNIFDVNEAGNATLAGSLTQNSDRRLKTNIEDLPYGLAEILQMQPKAYHWKKNRQNKKSLGLIAQDIQPLIAEIVNTQNDDMNTLGISYTELIPVLINAIKEQQNMISNQTNTISKLQGELSALKESFEQLRHDVTNPNRP